MPLAPPEVRAAAQQARQLWFEQLQDAIDEMAPKFSEASRKAIKRIKAGNYRRSAVNAAIDDVLKEGDHIMRRYLAEQLSEAAQAADRIDDVYRAYELEGRTTTYEPNTPGIPAAAKGSVALEQTAPLAGKLRKVTDSQLPGEVLARKELSDRHPRLSSSLHRSKMKRENRRAVHRTIREATALDAAGRELVRTVPTIGEGQAIPKALEAAKAAARNLAELANDPQALKDWNKALAKVEKIARTQKDARSAYDEFLQIVKKKGPEGVDSALNRWTDEKQRENAERIVQTESAAANRARESDQIQGNKDIVALIWRLSVGARKGYVRRTKPGKRGKNRGRRCICESMNGERFEKDAIERFPRMGHPRCLCWWERVYR